MDPRFTTNASPAITDGGRIIATALVALPLSCLLSLSGSVSIPLALAAMTVFVFVVIWTGLLALRIAGTADMPIAAAWVLGIFVTATVDYGLVELLDLTAARGFALWGVVVLVLGYASGRGSRFAPESNPRDLVALLVCGLMTVVWCRHVAAAPEVFSEQRLLPVWIDYLLHGRLVSQFGDVRAVGHGAIDLVGFPKSLYHYASYLLPAVFAEPLDLPGFPLATSVWLPVGFLTMCAGAYVLGTTLGGTVGGLVALASLTIVPDASTYGLRNGFFSYHWSILAYPGSDYAIGIALLSVSFLHRWSAQGSRRALLASALLVCGTFVFRANVFVLAFPAWVVTVAYSSRFFRERRLLFAVSLILSIAFAVFALHFTLQNLPATAGTWWRTGSAVERFLGEIHERQVPTAYAGWYQYLWNQYGRVAAIPVGVLLVFPASLGILCILYPGIAFLTHRSRPMAAIDAYPAFALMSYALLIMFAPSPADGDSMAFTHLPFVLLYAVISVWTATMLVHWIGLRGMRVQDRLWQTLLVFVVCALPVLWVEAAAMARPKFYWGKRYVTFTPENGVPEASVFLRHNAKPGDVFAVSGLTLSSVAIDVASELNGLTGIPAYIARPWIQIVKKGRREEVAMRRWTELVGIEREQEAAAALERLHRLGIQWYVFVGPAGPQWDPQRGGAAFSRGAVTVYRTAER